MNHSGGKFGFSVQKEMYIEFGGVPNSQLDREAFSRLAEKNGWKVNGTWNSVRFDISSPVGHLPTGGGKWFDTSISLFPHI